MVMPTYSIIQKEVDILIVLIAALAIFLFHGKSLYNISSIIKRISITSNHLHAFATFACFEKDI